MPNLYSNLSIENQNIWSEWIINPKCELFFPKSVKLTSFQKVLIVQALRPDRLFSAMCKFATKALGILFFLPKILIKFFD